MKNLNIEVAEDRAPRTLYFDIDLYAEGDAAFKRKLALLMIDNIRELQQSLHRAIERNDLDIFHRACHRVKPTIGILNDREFAGAIALLKEHQDENVTDAFEHICEGIIKMLEDEITGGSTLLG